MSHTRSASPLRILSTLVAALALSAPVMADHGYRGMAPDHPGCYYKHPGMASAGNCPYMKKHPGPAAMAGKMLGVMVSDVPNAILDASGSGHGVNVERVQPDSAAAEAGLRAGDLITEFAGSPVFSGDRLRWLVRKAETGKPMEIKLLREKQALTLTATLREPAPKAKCAEPGQPRLGT